MHIWQPPALPWLPVLLIAAFLATCLFPSPTQARTPETITVVGDESYAPFELRTATGECRGIFVDTWRLWSKKTGIEVNYRCMNWANALEMVEAGKAHVVGGIFFSDQRAERFDFTRPYLEIPTAIFFHSTIFGLKKLEDLTGFRIGVVKEDVAEAYVRKHLPNSTLLTYPSNEGLIAAAARGDIRVFIADTPVALFHLAKTGRDAEFRHTREPLYTSKVYSAVKKGNSELTEIINVGFDAIEPEDMEKITESWTGITGPKRLPWRLLLATLAGVGSFAGIILFWNYLLRRRVRHATRGLIESQRRFAKFMDFLPGAVFIKDSESRSIYLNKYMRDVLGADDSWLGKRTQEVLPLDIADRMVKDDREVLEGKYLIREEKLADIKGGTRYYQTHKFLIKETGGKDILGGIGIEITEQKKIQKEKESFQRQLQQAQKMEAIGTLAGGIAHDFNNILAAIIGYTELAIMELPESSSSAHKMQQILTAASRARDLVNQILAFSRQSNQEMKPMQLTPTVKEALHLLRASLPATIEIQEAYEGDATVMANHISLYQVLMNLCTNAAHAMKGTGGLLKVSLTNVTLGPDNTAEFAALKPGPHVKLTVLDTGHGIPSQKLDRIFDPFFTTKEKGQGTGMGLSVVHGIVKECGGHITVKSKQNAGDAGTEVTVYLPVIESVPAGSPPRNESVPKGNERILFVDDEQPIVEITGGMLGSLGYRVTTCTDPTEALVLFRKNAISFDLVITDLTMPQMTGLELAEKLQEIRGGIPIILCSGFSASIDENGLSQLGVKALIHKPILRRDLAETTRKVLDA